MSNNIEGGKSIWSRYTTSLPQDKAYLYSKSDQGPNLYGNKKPARYLLDRNDNIVGFSYGGKKLLFSNVNSDNGKILRDAKHTISRRSADQFIQAYANLYDDRKNKAKILATKKQNPSAYKFSHVAATEIGKMDWHRYAKPLPKEHEHYYAKSPDKPNVNVGEKNASYLIDKHDNIVGFAHDNKKFIFGTVIDDKGKILKSVDNGMTPKDADELIQDYHEMHGNEIHDDAESKYEEEVKPELATEPGENVITRAYEIPVNFKGFNRVLGEEYGIRPDSYRGANFLENKDRGIIGFRYHGKDFFVGEDPNKLLKRYKPDMASKSHDIEIVKLLINQHLGETKLGTMEPHYYQDVNETATSLHSEISKLKNKSSKMVEKESYGDKYLEGKYGPAVKKEIQDFRNLRGPMTDVWRKLNNEIRVLENDLAILSKPEFKVAPQELMKQKSAIQTLKEKSNAILEEASKTDDIKTLNKQLQELKEIDKQIQDIEASIKEDEESGFEFVGDPNTLRGF